MKFEWDENKNQKNIKKHGVSFEQACAIFESFTLDFIDERSDYSEVREVSIGRIKRITYLTVIHTDRSGIRRIISARQASKKERKHYEEELQKTFDA
jgi:hypothetical protein